MSVAYGLRPATHDDLPLLRRWLHTPDAVRWWGDPAEQEALLREDLDNPQMAMRIVSRDGHPFAYAQDYEVHAWRQPHLAHLPPGSRAIDTFIGEPAMIGRGHGSRYLRMLAERLLAEGAPLIAIDPDTENMRARRAYAKAGFRMDACVETASGAGGADDPSPSPAGGGSASEASRGGVTAPPNTPPRPPSRCSGGRPTPCRGG
jgi:aminoglycoside 6'-N-acetyltransferase